ncbi:MAG: hypothetical protein DI565_15970 [Ancylobacter novellus]|uniref:Uncharacterized protein n=1 Tax=Ancylobacter novellus TaxID=921 RepID=A0A2W5KA60_ANCNO|nr:MAG: hypothetical protein DI565_15970 [Ancylobacter novellus]
MTAPTPENDPADHAVPNDPAGAAAANDPADAGPAAGPAAPSPVEPAARPRNIRARANLVPHLRVPWTDPRALAAPAQNMVWQGEDPEHAWIAEATAKIGDWRSFTRSVYLRWALTINASVLAEGHYRGPAAGQALVVNTLRVRGGVPRQTEIARWPGPEAADVYAEITPLSAAYGVADLYGALEDVIFELYEIVLTHHPDLLMHGPAFRDLRAMRDRRGDSAEAEEQWRAAWTERLAKWRHDKAFLGLHRNLLTLFEHARLQRPSQYQHTDVADWARTLEMIGELRHHVTHGMATVSEKLARLSNMPTSLTFDFVAGATLEVSLHHLQSVELFCEQLLTAINLSLMERAMGPLRNIVAPPEPAPPRAQ